MTEAEIVSYAVGALGVLTGVILHLRAQNQLKDQQISTLKSTANLAGDVASANEAEEAANDSEKAYDNIRAKLLAGAANSGQSVTGSNAEPHSEGDL